MSDVIKFNVRPESVLLHDCISLRPETHVIDKINIDVKIADNAVCYTKKRIRIEWQQRVIVLLYILVHIEITNSVFTVINTIIMVIINIVEGLGL